MQIQPLSMDSTKFVLQIDVQQLLNTIQSREISNIKVADIARQLLLLSPQFNIRIDRIIYCMLGLYKQNHQRGINVDEFNSTLMIESELFMCNAMDDVIMDLTEHYPMLFNHLFDLQYYNQTGNVKLVEKQMFLSQFFDQNNELSNHYDYIVNDRLVNQLLVHHNDLLAILIDFIHWDDDLKQMILERLFGFFERLYYELMPFFQQMVTWDYVVSAETRFNVFGNTFLIIFEKRV